METKPERVGRWLLAVGRWLLAVGRWSLKPKSDVQGPKSKVSPRRAAFTLMEMLVVLAIIGLLVGMLFPALMRARERAKETRARSEIQTVQEAWLAYWATYTNFPAKSIAMDPAGVAILAGTDTAANPYGIAFMEFDQRHLAEGFRDPWWERIPGEEHYYQVVFDVGESTNVWHFTTRAHLINTARNRY